MITNAADYEFVTGITNGEVLIDGGIMPARDVAVETSSDVPPLMQPRCLRGEDMAFLAECAGERNTVMEQQQAQPHVYTRSIAAAQIDSIQQALARYIRPPTGADDCVYVKPDFHFTQKRVSINDDVLDVIYLRKNLLTRIYPDCVYDTPVSNNPNPLVGNDVRAMFWDASQTRKLVPNQNALGIDSYPVFPSGNISIYSTPVLHLAENNWSGDKRNDGPDITNSTTLLQTRTIGTSGVGTYYRYWNTLSQFRLEATIPNQTLDYIDGDVTIMPIVYAYQIVNHLNGSGYSTDRYYDLWGFPFTKTPTAQGIVSLDYTDYQTMRTGLDQTLADRNLPWPGWGGNTIIEGRLELILACPIIVSLGDHTDFSSLNWQWTP